MLGGLPRCTAFKPGSAQGDETARVLELWQDSKGANKGIMQFMSRYLYYPRHLPEGHKDRERKRSGLDSKQVYEQVDHQAGVDHNPLASVRCVRLVLCCWKSPTNRQPSAEELQRAHAWVDSGWDQQRLKVVPFDLVMDKSGDGALQQAHACSRAPAL